MTIKGILPVKAEVSARPTSIPSAGSGYKKFSSYPSCHSIKATPAMAIPATAPTDRLFLTDI